MAFSAERLATALDALDPGWRGARHVVAVSGGVDSMALLHAFAGLARRTGTALRAVHVDHGLQPGSSGWVAATAECCGRLGVPFDSAGLALAPARGESVEASAREARYAALASMLRAGERLHTAHHRDDQLETVLMQLLRGAGLAGLAAMPARTPFGAGLHLRPLLECDRAELEDYVRAQGLATHEDPMNGDLRFDRAWLRARVLPALRARWPAAATTVARSSGHVAEAARLLDEVARADAEPALDAGRLRVEALLRLSMERRKNLVRWWLRGAGLRLPAAAQLVGGLEDLLHARADGAPRLAWSGGEIRRYRGRLYAISARAPLSPAAARGDGSWELGAGLGRFDLVAGTCGGLSVERASGAVIRFRSGGESLKPHPGRPRKRLKALCQEAGIVPWMRDRLPLVVVGDRLAAVGDLWIDAEFAAPAGRPALKPVWTGRPPLY